MTDRIKSQFGAYTEALDVVKDVDLSGKTAIVTGAASGIGVETARALASAGAHVVLAVRNLEAGKQAADDIDTSVGAKRTSVEKLDLSSLASVREFAKRWGDKPLNLLINNAGVMATPQGKTADGFETQIGTNHFGHFELTKLLTPALVKGAPSRVVQLSSIGHRRSGINWDDVHFEKHPYDKWESYGQSKTANALFAVGFDKRYRDKGVRAFSVMPGGIMTGLQKHMAEEEKRALGWIDENGKVRDGFKTVSQGASTSVWAAVGKELDGAGGLYLENCEQAGPFDKAVPWIGVLPHAIDPEAADRLWVMTEETLSRTT